MKKLPIYDLVTFAGHAISFHSTKASVQKTNTQYGGQGRYLVLFGGLSWLLYLPGAYSGHGKLLIADACTR